MAPYGVCEVEHSTLRSSFVTPKRNMRVDRVQSDVFSMVQSSPAQSDAFSMVQSRKVLFFRCFCPAKR